MALNKKKSNMRSVVTVTFLLCTLLFVSGERFAEASLPIDPNLPSECSDFIDNDSDGFIDFVQVVGAAGNGPDPNCENIFDDSEGPASPPTSPTSPTSPISPPISPPSPPASECLNGEDDDGDGFVDDNDPNCHTDGDSN